MLTAHCLISSLPHHYYISECPGLGVSVVSAAAVTHGEDESVWTAVTDGSKLANPTNNKDPDKMFEIYMQLYDIPQIHFPFSQGDFRNLRLNHCLYVWVPGFNFLATFVLVAEPQLPWWRWGKSRQLQLNSSNTKDCTDFRCDKKICPKQKEWSKNRYEKGIPPNDSDHNSSVAFEMFVSTWISSSAAGSEDVWLCHWLKGNYTERWLRGGWEATTRAASWQNNQESGKSTSVIIHLNLKNQSRANSPL